MTNEKWKICLTVYCPLPSAFCLLLTAYCPLPTAFCPLLTVVSSITLPIYLDRAQDVTKGSLEITRLILRNHTNHVKQPAVTQSRGYRRNRLGLSGRLVHVL